MTDVIVTLILLAIIVPVVGYIVRAKKKSQACIGCPNSSKCGGGCHCNESEM